MIGRPANHIGASGVIYLLASFLFFKGIFSRYYRLIAISFIVVFLYGGLLWFVVPIEPGISWEGHLSGLLVGLVFALLYKENIAEPPKFEWEKPDYNQEDDPFMKHFDENGNFIEMPPDPQGGKIGEGESAGEQEKTVYKYSYKEHPKKGED